MKVDGKTMTRRHVLEGLGACSLLIRGKGVLPLPMVLPEARSAEGETERRNPSLETKPVPARYWRCRSDE